MMYIILSYYIIQYDESELIHYTLGVRILGVPCQFTITHYIFIYIKFQPFYISTQKLLPMSRFLPKPQAPKGPKVKRVGGGTPRGRGRGRGSFRGRGKIDIFFHF